MIAELIFKLLEMIFQKLQRSDQEKFIERANKKFLNGDKSEIGKLFDDSSD